MSPGRRDACTARCATWHDLRPDEGRGPPSKGFWKGLNTYQCCALRTAWHGPLHARSLDGALIALPCLRRHAPNAAPGCSYAPSAAPPSRRASPSTSDGTAPGRQAWGRAWPLASGLTVLAAAVAQDGWHPLHGSCAPVSVFRDFEGCAELGSVWHKQVWKAGLGGFWLLGTSLSAPLLTSWSWSGVESACTLSYQQSAVLSLIAGLEQL